jgi:hypothetical protein
MMSRFVSVACARVLVLAAALALPGCKKDEPPPPLPVEPAPSATVEAPLELKPEDAGAPPKPVEKPKTGTGSSAGSLQNCCAALTQNAASAPEPTRTYMLQAAAMCTAAAASGKDKQSIVGVLSGALKGAGLPVACK